MLGQGCICPRTRERAGQPAAWCGHSEWSRFPGRAWVYDSTPGSFLPQVVGCMSRASPGGPTAALGQDSLCGLCLQPGVRGCARPAAAGAPPRAAHRVWWDPEGGPSEEGHPTSSDSLPSRANPLGPWGP